MLQYLLTFVVLAQPAQPPTPAPPSDAPTAVPIAPSEVKPSSPEEGTAPAASPGSDVAGDPCDPTPKATGKPKKEMPPPPPRTDVEAGTYWMPPSASTNTDAVDWLFYGILGLTIFCFAGITIAVVYLTWRYRMRKGHKAEESASHNDLLEIVWTVIPSVLCVFLFVWGWQGFLDLNTPPRHAYEVQVVAEKWNWTFKYPNGWVDNNLHVPVDEPVKLTMRSKDVLHSFYVPAFRAKNDVIPNRYTKLWFEATEPGVYRLYCAEYCGTEHSAMKRLVVVHEPGGFKKYLEEAEQVLLDMPPVALGKYLFETRGCQQCHSVDGTAKTGPTWKGIFGASHATSAGNVTVDENYLRESILEPNAKVRAGYNAVMPTFKGQLKDEQIDGLITYIKCLK